MRIFDIAVITLWFGAVALVGLLTIIGSYYLMYETQWIVDLSQTNHPLSFLLMFIIIVFPLLLIAYIGSALACGGVYLFVYVSEKPLMLRSAFWVGWLLAFPVMIIWALVIGSILVKSYLAERLFGIENLDS